MPRTLRARMALRPSAIIALRRRRKANWRADGIISISPSEEAVSNFHERLPWYDASKSGGYGGGDGEPFSEQPGTWLHRTRALAMCSELRGKQICMT
jgi:hypothetical protein